MTTLSNSGFKMRFTTHAAKWIAAVLIILLSSFPLFASRFYVVVGSFSQERAARDLAESLRSLYGGASVKFDQDREVYHVYVLETDRFLEAETFRDELKKQKAIVHGWIFSESGNSTVVEGGVGNEGPVKLELYTGNTVLLSSADNSVITIARDRGVVDEKSRSETETPFRFVAKNHSGVALPGKVTLTNRGTELSVFRTGEVVSFGGRQQQFTLVCEVPGFNPEIRAINISDLGRIAGIAHDTRGVWEVSFNVSRSVLNKIPLIYHNVFYENAAIMKPSSKEATDLLVALAQGSKGRIIINSHCNPRATREMTLRGDEDHYFGIEEAVRSSGSEKQFTKARAQALSDYLVSQGVDRHRISIMGWGSLDMLVKGAEENTDINDRIEVELMME